MRTLFLTMAVCLLAVAAQAKYSGGSGMPGDPYQIATVADLVLLGDSPTDYDRHFVLTADIDLDPKLQPIECSFSARAKRLSRLFGIGLLSFYPTAI